MPGRDAYGFTPNNIYNNVLTSRVKAPTEIVHPARNSPRFDATVRAERTKLRLRIRTDPPGLTQEGASLSLSLSLSL